MAEYYLDPEFYDLELTGTLTFTNGSTTVTGSGTQFTSELSVGDYIRSTDGTNGGTWYKVTGISDDTTLTINTSFKESTHSATAVRNKGPGIPEDLTGTVTFTSGSNQVTGSGTQFTSELSVGDYIRPSGKSTFYKVTSISDDATLIIDRDAEESFSGTAQRLRPFCHIAQYTTDTVRSPGDVLLCLPGTLVAVWKIDCDEDGTQENLISVKKFKWFPVNDEDFIIDYKWQNAYITTNYDECWCFDGIGATNGYDNHIYAGNTSYICIKNCKITNFTYTYCESILISNVGMSEIDNIVFDDIYNCCISIYYGGKHKISNCIVNTTNTQAKKGITLGAGIVELINCDFSKAQTPIYKSERNTCDCYINQKQAIYSTTTKNRLSPATKIRFNDEVWFANNNSKIAKSTETFSTGNEALAFTTDITWKIPIQVNDDWVIELPAGDYTITVKAKASGLTSFPDKDLLFIEVWHFDEADSDHIGIVRSTQEISANDTETDLSVSFTQAKDGPVRIFVYCGFNTVDNGGGTIYIENGFTVS